MSNHIPTESLRRASTALTAQAANIQDRASRLPAGEYRDAMIEEISRVLSARDDILRVTRERDAAERDAIRQACYGNR